MLQRSNNNWYDKGLTHQRVLIATSYIYATTICKSYYLISCKFFLTPISCKLMKQWGGCLEKELIYEDVQFIFATPFWCIYASCPSVGHD